MPFSKSFGHGAVSTVAGLVGDMARRRFAGTYTRAKANARVHGRNVRRARANTRLRNRRRRTGKKYTDVDGTFVKCHDAKKRSVNRKKLRQRRKFAHRVNNIVHSNLPKAIELHDFSFAVQPNDTGTVSDHVAWFQFAVDAINVPVGGAGHAGKLSGYTATAGNPSGYGQFLQVSSSANPPQPSTGTSFVRNPTIMGTISDNFASLNNITAYGSRGTQKWRLGATYAKFQMKNVASYGGTLELYWVKPRRATPVINDDQAVNLRTRFNADYTGAELGDNPMRPPAYAAATLMQQTPLEVANLGLARMTQAAVNTNGSNMCCHTMYGLADSYEFRQQFKIVKKCKVYMPPGGLVERSIYHKNGRTITTDYVGRYLHDSRTTYLVGRWLPEPTMVYVGGDTQAPGLPHGDSALNLAWDLVGTLSVKTVMKMLWTNQTQETELVRVNIPTGTTVPGYANTTHAKQ